MKQTAQQKAFLKVFGPSLEAQAKLNEKMKGRDPKLRTVRYGKTSRDKANGHIPHRKNRRVWDDASRTWVKV